MNARLALSTPLLFLTTCVAAFAPAPVYKEPPKPARSSLEKAMQGTWARGRIARVRIEGKTWTNLLPAGRRAARANIAYEIHLDTNRDPATLDLKLADSTRVLMRGIVKVEGDRLIFCYTRSRSEEDRPKVFDDTRTPGDPVRTMILTRIDPSDASP